MIERTTDFLLWLDCADPQDWETLFALRESLNGGEMYPFRTWQRGDIQGIRLDNGVYDLTLILASSKAKKYFVSLVEKEYCLETGNLDLEPEVRRILEDGD